MEDRVTKVDISSHLSKESDDMVFNPLSFVVIA